MKKKNLIITMVLAVTLLFTAMTCISFAEEDYETISVGQTKKVTYTEDNEGYTTFAFTPQESCTYLFESSRYNGQYSDPYGTVFVVDEDGMTWNEIAYNGDIDEDNYMFRVAFAAEAGKTYYLEAYVDYDETCNVSVRKSPVQAIEFLPKEPYTYIENAGGEWEENEETGEQFYYYDIPSFANGDVLKITKSDGSTVSYTYSYDDEEDDEGFFVSSAGSISEEDVYRDDHQYEEHWAIDKENYLTVSYMGVEFKVPVEITENPYSGFEFRPAKPYTFVEYGEGEWDWDDDDNKFFFYDIPWYEDGDQVIITLKTGETVVYTYSEDDEGFTSPDGVYIYEDNIERSGNQYNEHWEKGKTNYITYEYMGFEYKLPVEIVDNPVKSIKFTPAYPCVYEAENKEYGEYELDDNDKRYFHYYLPGFSDGDILTITTDEGTKDYVYAFDDEDEYEGYFVCDGEKIWEEDVDIDSDQYEKHWTGGTNYYTVKYSGQECKVALEIKKAKQPMTVKPVKKTFKAKALKKKKAVFKPVTVKNYKGKLTYKAKVSGKSKKVLSFSSKTKKLTVKKGAKKGKYTIKITVTAAGNSSFLKGSKTVKVVVNVK